MKIDLNLLRVFDVLMETRSVSRAAVRLGLTQSAVSHALARLREQVGDPLFTRSRAGLKPTGRASDMASVVQNALTQLHEAIAPSGFDPATTARLFTIAASAYFSATLLPIAVQRAREAAPGARFRILAPGVDLLSDLDSGTIDIALSSVTDVPARFSHAALFHERLVWAGRAGTDFSDIARRPRIALIRPPQPRAPEDRMMHGHLEARIELVPTLMSADTEVPLTIQDPVSAIAFVATSDLVALLPRQLALRVRGRRDVDFKQADGLEPVAVSMLWHSRMTNDPAHAWLRGLLAEAGAALE